MPTRFQRRILAGRTRSLAMRGVAVADNLLSPRLVCVAGDRHVALPVELVASVRPFACHAVPLVQARAVGIMLGMSMVGRKLCSVLDLRRLLGIGEAVDTEDGVSAAGSMVMVRSIEPPVALRVDRVLGVLSLGVSEEPGRAILMNGTATSEGLPPLVMLIEADTIAAAVAALEGG